MARSVDVVLNSTFTVSTELRASCRSIW